MVNFGISVVGRDGPGIIAAISKVLYELDCNLADTNMSVLSGNFAMVLVAQAPESLSVERLRHELALTTKRFNVLVSVQQLVETAEPASAQATERALVSLYGADRPGIVQGVTSAIAATASNVVDLRTQKTSQPNSLYTLVMEVDLAPGVTPPSLDKRLKAVAREFGVDLSVQNLAAAEL